MKDKATEAKIWHNKNGVVCMTCKHFRGIEAKFGRKKEVMTYCEFNTYGRGRFEFEFCNQWEERDDAEGSL